MAATVFNPVMQVHAIAAVMVITAQCGCQPLGWKAAALAIWTSQIRAESNLHRSVQGKR